MAGVEDKNILDLFCEEFCSIVEKFTDYIIVSGFVVISSGRTRATEDIDMIIKEIDIQTFFKMHDNLIQNGFVCVQSDLKEEIFDYFKSNSSVRYTRRDEPLPEMEIKFCKDKLDDYQFETRTKLSLTGLNLWFSSINMNIAFKEYLLKSEKDLKDAEHLRKVYPELVNKEEIKKIIKMIDVYRK
jgi:hypothetical protein